MVETQKFIRMIDRNNKHNVMKLASDAVTDLLVGVDTVRIEIREKTRSDEQNAKLHAMLGEIAKQKTFNNEKLSIEQWKMIFVSGHAVATKSKATMAIGLEGEVINLRESTARMSPKRCASLIEYINAWAADEGFMFEGGN